MRRIAPELRGAYRVADDVEMAALEARRHVRALVELPLELGRQRLLGGGALRLLDHCGRVHLREVEVEVEVEEVR